MIVWDFVEKQGVLIRENDCFATDANKSLAGLYLALLITVRLERLNRIQRLAWKFVKSKCTNRLIGKLIFLLWNCAIAIIINGFC